LGCGAYTQTARYLLEKLSPVVGFLGKDAPREHESLLWGPSLFSCVFLTLVVKHRERHHSSKLTNLELLTSNAG